MSGFPAKAFTFDAFTAHDTHGVPIGVALVAAKRAGVPVSLPAFYKAAVAHGWRPQKAIAVVREALQDAGESPAYVAAACAFLEAL
jgi:alanyl-tRNA synthetase